MLVDARLWIVEIAAQDYGHQPTQSEHLFEAELAAE
jgi:hypothetical protein